MEAYERLRGQVVGPNGRVDYLEGRGIFLRCGLAAWARLRPATLFAHFPESHSQTTPQSPVLDSFGAELVRLVAGLILNIRLEDFLHA